MKASLNSLMVFTACLPFQATAATVNWDLADWGISESGFDSAITAAHDHFLTTPDDTIIIHIPAGTYDITGADGRSIDLRNGYLLGPADEGRLIFQGAGMEETVLVFSDTDTTQIYGRNLAHVTFRDMHMTRAQYTVSQGTVVAVNLDANPDYIDLEIHDGFPMPDEIVRWSAPQGLYLRRYTASKTDPLVITDGKNEQVRWSETDSYALSTSPEGIVTWRMVRAFAGEFTNYEIGEYVAIKSKHTGNTFWFSDSDDIIFENMKWTHSTRGVFRQGTSNVRFTGCRFERSPPINGQTPCLSSPAGGPQMGQPSPDAVSTNMVVENCYIESTGDDCVAFFNVNGGVVRNCVFRDSFARGILMTEEASNIRFEGNVIVSRGPIEGAGDAGAEAIAPAQPIGLSLVDGSGTCRLSWDANTEPDLHFYQIYRQLNGVWWEYAITTDTVYNDLWALDGIIHSYYIESVDFSGNHSVASEIVSEPPDYAIWIKGHGVTSQDALETADLEPDGFSNFMEYALGGDPTIRDASVIQPAFKMTAESGSVYLEYVYRRRRDHVSRGINYRVEATEALLLEGWDTDRVKETGSETIGDGLFEKVTNRLSVGESSAQFMRLRIGQ
ncbi:right-handed parallel beta-helix repeat-containing protein [Puniceicoccales bacterium CK1056]|uniref:Right-handed parallel beta-helix repeat-containing protein n=1 Tax=Oceanipulchritudo coccoides TaxID=2706888 RepID=A0A6B2LZS1_9BACT|nr:right-handed parallel beta-helix repeat-containing protein [Oceanipulchritudo coccoides]NDV61549.1 right-handed parallel beta-helix repeat-containing protein [Oceanipulchritudo coccoides]